MFFFQLIKSFFNGSSTHYTFHLSLLRSCCLSCICGSWCVLHVLNLWCVCNLVDYSEVAKVFKRTYMGCWISMQVYFLCCSCFQKKKKNWFISRRRLWHVRTLYLDVRTHGFQVFFAVFFFLNFKVFFFSLAIPSTTPPLLDLVFVILLIVGCFLLLASASFIFKVFFSSYSLLSCLRFSMLGLIFYYFLFLFEFGCWIWFFK
jgi:hypothetical protein